MVGRHDRTHTASDIQIASNSMTEKQSSACSVFGAHDHSTKTVQRNKSKHTLVLLAANRTDVPHTPSSRPYRNQIPHNHFNQKHTTTRPWWCVQTGHIVIAHVLNYNCRIHSLQFLQMHCVIFNTTSLYKNHKITNMWCVLTQITMNNFLLCKDKDKKNFVSTQFTTKKCGVYQHKNKLYIDTIHNITNMWCVLAQITMNNFFYVKTRTKISSVSTQSILLQTYCGINLSQALNVTCNFREDECT